MVRVVCGRWRSGGKAPRRSGNLWEHHGICGPCDGSLRRATELRLRSGILVRPLYLHEGPIRSAVHALKYRGADRVAEVLAPFLTGLLPDDTSALVPVPRALARTIRYGIDPGRVLAMRSSIASAKAELRDRLSALSGRGYDARVSRIEGHVNSLISIVDQVDSARPALLRALADGEIKRRGL